MGVCRDVRSAPKEGKWVPMTGGWSEEVSEWLQNNRLRCIISWDVNQWESRADKEVVERHQTCSLEGTTELQTILPKDTPGYRCAGPGGIEWQEMGLICSPDLLAQKQGYIKYQGEGGQTELNKEKAFVLPIFQINLGKSLGNTQIIPILILFDKHFCEQKSWSLVFYKAESHGWIISCLTVSEWYFSCTPEYQCIHRYQLSFLSSYQYCQMENLCVRLPDSHPLQCPSSSRLSLEIRVGPTRDGGSTSCGAVLQE